MHTALTTLIDRLDHPQIRDAHVIPWGCPVTVFGDFSRARVATLGLNPSNREFMDPSGRELEGAQRRFHTLSSLGLKSWLEADARHLRMILESYRTYFRANPYDTWFKRLNAVIAGTNTSYYDVSRAACHLDVIPYATTRKWTNLTTKQRAALLTVAGDTLALVLRESPIRILILNGNSVVRTFEAIANVTLDKRAVPEWSLPRRTVHDVMGFAYKGMVEALFGIELGHKLLILGFNHNLQSSFGVTTKIVHGVRQWIAHAAREATHETTGS